MGSKGPSDNLIPLNIESTRIFTIRVQRLRPTPGTTIRLQELPLTRLDTLWNFTFSLVNFDIKMPVYKVTSAESLRSYVDIFPRCLTLSFLMRTVPCNCNVPAPTTPAGFETWADSTLRVASQRSNQLGQRVRPAGEKLAGRLDCHTM